MTNFERVGVMVSSWIWGRATMSTSYLLGEGSTVSAPPGHSSPRRPRRRVLTRCNALDAAPLPRAASVVGHRGDVLDSQDLQSGGGEGPDGRLAPGAGALDEDVDFGEAVLLGPPGRRLGRELRGERRGLARTLEPDVPRTGPGQGVPVQVGDGHDGVVERGLDVRLTVGDVLALPPPGLLGLRLGHAVPLLPLLPANSHRLLGTLAGPGIGVGPLPAHRETAAMTDA